MVKFVFDYFHIYFSIFFFQHLVTHLINESLQTKDIIQSSFDLLGELMKFNASGYKQFNECIESTSQVYHGFFFLNS